MRDFENENIILNPYNTSNNRNGYDEVKMDFFKTSIEKGQAKVKNLYCQNILYYKTKQEQILFFVFGKFLQQRD